MRKVKKQGIVSLFPFNKRKKDLPRDDEQRSYANELSSESTEYTDAEAEYAGEIASADEQLDYRQELSVDEHNDLFAARDDVRRTRATKKRRNLHSRLITAMTATSTVAVISLAIVSTAAMVSLESHNITETSAYFAFNIINPREIELCATLECDGCETEILDVRDGELVIDELSSDTYYRISVCDRERRSTYFSYRFKTQAVSRPTDTTPSDTTIADTTPPETTPPDTVPPDTTVPNTPPETTPPDTVPPDTTVPNTPSETTPPDTVPPDTTVPDIPPETTPSDTTPNDTTSPSPPEAEVMLSASHHNELTFAVHIANLNDMRAEAILCDSEGAEIERRELGAESEITYRGLMAKSLYTLNVNCGEELIYSRSFMTADYPAITANTKLVRSSHDELAFEIDLVNDSPRIVEVALYMVSPNGEYEVARRTLISGKNEITFNSLAAMSDYRLVVEHNSTTIAELNSSTEDYPVPVVTATREDTSGALTLTVGLLANYFTPQPESLKVRLYHNNAMVNELVLDEGELEYTALTPNTTYRLDVVCERTDTVVFSKEYTTARALTFEADASGIVSATINRDLRQSVEMIYLTNGYGAPIYLSSQMNTYMDTQSGTYSTSLPIYSGNYTVHMAGYYPDAPDREYTYDTYIAAVERPQINVEFDDAARTVELTFARGTPDGIDYIELVLLTNGVANQNVVPIKQAESVITLSFDQFIDPTNGQLSGDEFIITAIFYRNTYNLGKHTININ